MTEEKIIQLYGQTIQLPKTTKSYGAIRKVAMFRSKTVVTKLSNIEQQSLHLVAAFEKICVEKAAYIDHEIDYYVSQAKLLHTDLDETAFRQQSYESIFNIEQFEANVRQQFETAKSTHNLKAINEDIFTPFMFQQYYDTIYDALLQLHLVYMSYVALAKNDPSWAPNALPFQQWERAKEFVDVLKKTPSKQTVVTLLLTDPYEPIHVAIAYALYGDTDGELRTFLEEIAFTDVDDVLKRCEDAHTLFDDRNAMIHLESYENPLFRTLLQQDAFTSLTSLCAYVISQFSDTARPYLSQHEASDILFAYTIRKNTILSLTSTTLKGKGKWFRTIQVPYTDIRQQHIRDGLCAINQTIVHTPHFERQDDVLMMQLLQLLTVIATTHVSISNH